MYSPHKQSKFIQINVTDGDDKQDTTASELLEPDL